MPITPRSGAQMYANPLVLFFSEVSFVDTDRELTENEEILAAINTAVQNRARVDQQGYMIGTRRLDRIPLEDLQAMRSTYITAVRFEKGKAFGSIKVKL